MTDERPKRPWLQFSLRTLLVFVLLVSLFMSWFVVKLRPAQKRQKVVEMVQEAGGLVRYKYKDTSKSYLHLSSDFKDTPIPAWLLDLLGTDFFMRVSEVDLYSSNGFGDERMSELAKLANLESLSLARSQVTDAGLVHLKGMSNLKGLCLYETQVTDAGLTHLAGMTDLRSLRLSGTQVTDVGLAHLKQLTSLSSLNLNETQVTDAGLEHLEGLTNLDSLDLYNTQVTAEGVESLRQFLPDCDISSEFQP
jgi:Leucine-rich repeat (LRR) protein